MQYKTQWRTKPKRNGRRDIPDWTEYMGPSNREAMFRHRKELLVLGHEVRVLLGDTEIEVEDDDQ